MLNNAEAVNLLGQLIGEATARKAALKESDDFKKAYSTWRAYAIDALAPLGEAHPAVLEFEGINNGGTIDSCETMAGAFEFTKELFEGDIGRLRAARLQLSRRAKSS
jgi:hypothetical protein